MESLAAAPTAPAPSDPGVGTANIAISTVGQTNGTRATNVWYKLFKYWCHFNYGAAQTGFNAKTTPGLDDGSIWPNNNWRTLPAFGPISFEFAQRQLRPETGFFDHERMPIVILDNKHAYLCAGFPLCLGMVHSFFEVSVWIADNLDPGFTGLSGTPTMTELTRVDPADIQSLGLQTLVLADGTVRHRDANSDDAVRCRGFCGLVYRNRVRPTTGFDAAVDNAVIPAGKTIWQQWGPGQIPGFAGGTLVYGTDETDLKKILPPTTHNNYVTGFGGTGHGSSMDFVNNNLETAEAYLLDPLLNPTGGTILSGAGTFIDKTYVRDLYRDHGGACMYVSIPTVVGSGDTVFWRRNGVQSATYPSPAAYMNGVSLAMQSSAYRLSIPPAPFPVRSKWGTFVQSYPYKPDTFNFAPMVAEPLMFPDPVYSHTSGWFLPALSYSFSSSGVGGDAPDPAGSGIFPYNGTAFAAVSKTSADRITSWPASTSSSIVGALSGVLLYNQRRTLFSGVGTCAHIESMLRVSDSNGPVVSNFTSDYFPNPGTTVVDGPSEILQVCFVSWNFTVTCYCETHDFATSTTTVIPSSAEVQIVIWDTANNVAGIVLQTGTITDGLDVQPNGFLFHGTQEIALADLPAEWALIAICTTAPIPPSPPVSAGLASSEAWVWIMQNVMGSPIFDYWLGVPRADVETKYMRTEMVVRGNVLMDEDIQGIDVPYCATYNPFPFDTPGTG